MGENKWRVWKVSERASPGAGTAESVCVKAPDTAAAGLLGAGTGEVVGVLAVPEVGGSKENEEWNQFSQNERLGHEGWTSGHGNSPGNLSGFEEGL